MASWLAVAGVGLVGAAWLAHRQKQTAEYGVSRLDKVVFERFPAARAQYSRAVAVTGGCGACMTWSRCDNMPNEMRSECFNSLFYFIS